MDSIKGQSYTVTFILYLWVCLSDGILNSAVDTNAGKVVDTRLAAHE